MTPDDELAAWLRLALAPGVGGETQRKLLAAFGLPEAIFSADRLTLRSIVGEKADLLLDTDNRQDIEQAITWAREPDHHIISLADDSYPKLLLETPDPPILLYVNGNPELLNTPALAIVGSRNATAQGMQTAAGFAKTLAANGFTITSGLALGIDTAAHKGALVGGKTVAFIGTGADRLYPARNKELALAIAEQGAIVSEFPLGTPALAANFPRRNRLISGMSRGVLVVEAALESGSLITARMAAEQGREVFAIPGSIHSPVARGCHRLIKQGAKLVETTQDILEELGLQTGLLPPPPNRAREEDPILKALGHDPCSIDELSERTGLPSEEMQSRLLMLELAGKVATIPGGRYQRVEI